MTGSTIHGFPRIGPRRELKAAVEGYWAGRIDADQLGRTAAELRRQTWTFLHDAGLAQVPSNHFSLYDQVLDTAVLVGAVPERFRAGFPRTPAGALDRYFAMARGHQGRGVAAMEMTKWFDTNYHYLVPELPPASTAFRCWTRCWMCTSSCWTNSRRPGRSGSSSTSPPSHRTAPLGSWTRSQQPMIASGTAPTDRNCWSRATSTISARRWARSPARRSRVSGSTSPAAARTTSRCSARPEGSPARRWWPGSSTGATCG